MSYTTLSELSERYGADFLVGLTDRGEVATGQIDADVVDRAILEAQATIDGYVKRRYVLPLTPVPALIATLARQITIYTLHVYEPNPKITAEYEAALRQLREIASGVIALDAEGATPAQTDSGGAQVTDRERPFTAQNMKGFV
ncbi:DUF1320 domain-containing protein [uncultured Tateyamaria sp.]|uniref:gp436 family protein n=1 Tax=uncultured Tateyamaria sp. TaxID=455651 RepID=UPI00261B0912|nr:DUF1320 domain-containing protein [uncultured Tateyamaria sp.]